jgi:hypothetical protein
MQTGSCTLIAIHAVFEGFPNTCRQPPSWNIVFQYYLSWEEVSFLPGTAASQSGRTPLRQATA